jgi:hypothetical protein
MHKHPSTDTSGPHHTFLVHTQVYDDEDSYGKQSGTGNRYYGAKNSHYKHDRSSKKVSVFDVVH